MLQESKYEEMDLEPSEEELREREIFKKEGWDGLSRYLGFDARPIGVIIRQEYAKANNLDD